MNKILNAGLAALVAAGSVAAVATPAAAHDDRYGYGDYGHHDNTGAIIAGGIAGLALGAILSSGHTSSYGSGYYGNGYSSYGNGYSSYGNGYSGYGDSYSGYGNGDYGNGYNSYGNGYGNSGYGYRQCVGRRTVWSPYYGQYVVQKVRYAC